MAETFNFFEILGWIGNIVLSIGIIPQVYQTWKTHSVKSFNWAFLIMWMAGVYLTFVYIIYGNIKSGYWQWPLLLNYLVNILGTTYLFWAKIRYGGKEDIQ